MEKIKTEIQKEVKEKTINDLEKENKAIENRQLLLGLEHSNSNRFWNFIKFLIISLIFPAIYFIYAQHDIKIKQENDKTQIEIKNKEVALKDIEIQIKLMNFFLDNYEQVFSKDTIVVHNISQVFAVFPTKYTTELFNKIKELSTEQNKKIWEAKEEIALDIEGINATVDYYNNDYKLKSILEQDGYTIRFKPSTYNNINTIWCSKNTDIEIIKRLAFVLNDYGCKIDVITHFSGKHKNNRKNYFIIGDHAETLLDKIQNWDKTKIKTMTINDIK